jgi:hypothetical protein
MDELLVGYARVSTEQQDLTAQRNGLHALGVGDDRIYVDHGLGQLEPSDSSAMAGWVSPTSRVPPADRALPSSRNSSRGRLPTGTLMYR